MSVKIKTTVLFSGAPVLRSDTPPFVLNVPFCGHQIAVGGWGAGSIYILVQRLKKGGKVLCSLCFEGTVPSHDVHEELAGITHGVLERLAAGGELGRNRGQLPPGGCPGRRAAAHRGFGGQVSQAVRGRQAWGAVGGGVAPLALRAGARARLGEGGVAVGEGRVVVLRERVAPVRVAVTEAGPGVAVAGDGVAVMAHLAGRPVAASASADPRLGLAAHGPLTFLLRGAPVFACTWVGATASTSCCKRNKGTL